VRVGEEVIIRRSNDVIPEVLGAVIASEAHQSLPEDISSCPSCGVELVKKGAHKFCESQNCSAKILEKFSHFVSRDCMNIEGLSDKTLEVLVAKGFIKTLGDIYRITASELMGLEGFKDKKINNLLDAIKESKQVDLSRFINGLGIPNIGKKASLTLATNMDNAFELFELTQAELVQMEDFGEIMAQSVVEFFRANREEVEDLLSYVKAKGKERVDGILSDLKICITGTLAGYTRSQLAKTLEELGAIVVDGVSKATDVLIVGEGAGSKLEKAQKLGIKIIDEIHLSSFLRDGRI